MLPVLCHFCSSLSCLCLQEMDMSSGLIISLGACESLLCVASSHSEPMLSHYCLSVIPTDRTQNKQVSWSFQSPWPQTPEC